MAQSFSQRIKGTTPYYNMIRRVVFPSTISIVVLLLVLTTIGVGSSFAIANNAAQSFIEGILWGLLVLAVPSFASSSALYFAFMKEDPLFYFRRCQAFSLFTITIWVTVLFVGSISASVLTGFVFPDFAIVVGLFIVVPVRALAVFSMSRVNFIKRTLFTLVEPVLTSMSVVLIFQVSAALTMMGLTLASLVGLIFAFSLISVIEMHGRRIIGFSPIRMFRAFLTNWLEGENQELESYLNELGVETEIDLTTLAFRSKQNKKMKALMLVSNYHPGPFLNVGSSALPFVFQSLVSRKFNAVGFVPHGVSGHELNLVSQEQNVRLIRWVISNIENARYLETATPVARSRNEIATATSQVFDGCALVTMTTSPYDMEDVPSEVASRLAGLIHGRFTHLALVDAHNCLTGPTTMSSQKIGALEEAALSALQVSSEENAISFRVGASHRVPVGFTLKDGLGPAGISVLGIEIGGQRFAYVNVDGNNMVRGLREEILEVARRIGYSDGEVMTTDTHMVNGVVSARLGYHTIGEVVPKGVLLEEIAAACQEALSSLERCEVGVVSGQVPVTTLGSKSLRRLMSFVHRISTLTAMALFPVVIVIAAFSLLLLM